MLFGTDEAGSVISGVEVTPATPSQSMASERLERCAGEGGRIGLRLLLALVDLGRLLQSLLDQLDIRLGSCDSPCGGLADRS